RGRLNELGIRHQFEKAGITYSITAYDFRIDRAILPYSVTNEVGESVQRYHNEGSTLQQGVEWTFEWLFLRGKSDFEFKYWNNGTLNRHRFDKYTLDGTILNDNSMPGVPMAQMSTGIQSTYKGISLSVFD
ncbi:MAG: TonB-dependent receptor domain-containing protein, partial [Flavobacteriales bacterium]